MNFLFDLGHPAHFHLFKNVIYDLKTKGHQIWITAKSKDVLLELLEFSHLEYIELKKNRNRILDHIRAVFTLRKLINKYRIDIVVGVSAIAPQAAIGTRTKSIVFDDDDISATPVFAALSHRFANSVLSPEILKKERNRKKDIFHQSFHELAYLHPKEFQPDTGVLKKLGVKNDEFFSIIRFSALNAHHDKGESGINISQAEKLIKTLKEKGRVFITSEKKLPIHLQQYQLKINPSEFHNVLTYASILVCDSQTVASEAAVLGVPSVRINTFVGRISYLEELEHQYQLTFGFNPTQFEKAINKIQSIISTAELKEIFQERRRKMLSEKIDFSNFMVWFIENYPESVKIMKENPIETQKQFL